ncbi:MAG: hypothetical protein ABJA67_16530 [Chthonomonadales bacterium]
MSLVESARSQTYRVHFAVGSLAGVNVEICNPANSGKRITVRRSVLRTDTGVQATVKRSASGVTGGTSSAFTPVLMASDQVASVATAKVFTVAPTESGSPTSFGRMDLVTGGYYDSGHQSIAEQEHITLLPGEYLTLVTNAAGATLTGFIDWSER